jgi:hypothetical protein
LLKGPNLIYKDNIKGREGLTQPEIDAINSGELLLVMYGTLKYDDAFGPLTSRTTVSFTLLTPADFRVAKGTIAQTEITLLGRAATRMNLDEQISYYEEKVRLGEKTYSKASPG